MSDIGNAHGYALDDFCGRVDDDEIEDLLERRPHPDAVFDALWWSRYEPISIRAWRFVFACKAGCPDAWGTMPAAQDPESHPKECPDCGGPVSRLPRAWNVPINAAPCPWDDD